MTWQALKLQCSVRHWSRNFFLLLEQMPMLRLDPTETLQVEKLEERTTQVSTKEPLGYSTLVAFKALFEWTTLSKLSVVKFSRSSNLLVDLGDTSAKLWRVVLAFDEHLLIASVSVASIPALATGSQIVQAIWPWPGDGCK